jgi:FkbM family methyltransferase
VQLGRRLRHMGRVYQHDGVTALLWELLFQALKPFLRVYEQSVFHFYSMIGQTSFPVRGSRITVLKDDPGLSQELAAYHIHEPLASNLLEQTLMSGMTVIDIGGNIGYYALLEAQLVGSSGKVIAIEPVPRNVAQLRDNVRANERGNIEIHELAIGKHNGTQALYLSSKSNHHSLLPTRSADTLMVSVSRLDDFVSAAKLPSVNLIRMDLEGYEIEILSGMQHTLKRYGPHLLIELHPHFVETTALLSYLTTLQLLGYAPEWAFEQERDYPIRWRFMKPEHPTMDELMQDPRIRNDMRTMTVLFAPVRHATSKMELLTYETPDVSTQDLRGAYSR